jgi:hypothetical protein
MDSQTTIESNDDDIEAIEGEQPGLQEESRWGKQRCNRLHELMLWNGMGEVKPGEQRPDWQLLWCSAGAVSVWVWTGFTFAPVNHRKSSQLRDGFRLPSSCALSRLTRVLCHSGLSGLHRIVDKLRVKQRL